MSCKYFYSEYLLNWYVVKYKYEYKYFENILILILSFKQVQTYLESLLTHAENDSTLAYLRSLTAVYTATTELVDDLKSLDMKQKKNVTPSKIAEEGSRKNNTIAELLDQCIEDLFVPYTEGDRYIEKEKKSLNELYSSLLLQFNAYHVSEK